LLLDVGANAEVKPNNLLEFGQLGSRYAQRVMRRPNPRIGLLSNGEEPEKGPLVIQGAHQLLKASGLNFVGNVEGKDVTSGDFDVVVCDGFAGNVLIKTAEGVGEFVVGRIRAELTANIVNKLLAAGLRPAFRRIGRQFDYAEYGGAPLVGLNGVAIVAHGRSTPRAIRNALRNARDAAAFQAELTRTPASAGDKIEDG
jgi:glycerol-3-phosphate acyltransferase PlsX